MTVFDDAYAYFKENPDELAYMWTRFNWTFPPPKPFLEFVFRGAEYVAWRDGQPEPPPPARKVRITTPKLNVRSGPGTTASIVGSLLAGDVVEVVDMPPENGDWLHLTENNVVRGVKISGWIHGDFTEAA